MLAFCIGGINMATKTTTKKAKKKTNKATYKNNEYTILEHQDGKYKLTDGVIHFWVREKDVKAD